VAWPLPDGAVLGILGERPDVGVVKPRIASSGGAEFAALASEAMLLDTLDAWGSDRFLAPGGRRVVVFDPPDAGPWFDERAPASLALQAQSGSDRGERLRSFFEGEFGDGAWRVVVIGSDCPTLAPEFVISAFLLLGAKDVALGPEAGGGLYKDVVLGPATDGGLYLVGCRPPVPPLFEGIDWRGPSVLAQVVRRVRDAGRSLAILPPWYSVDSAEGWEMLSGHVLGMRQSGMDPRCPRVERLIGDGR
jgi:glycosyltransferase A (GT-A) superfamily protein (DUF2064 family)